MRRTVVDVGRLVALLGLALLVVGGAIMLSGRLQLPGDTVVRRGAFALVFPVVACVVVSIVLNVLLRPR